MGVLFPTHRVVLESSLPPEGLRAAVVFALLLVVLAVPALGREGAPLEALRRRDGDREPATGDRCHRG